MNNSLGKYLMIIGTCIIVAGIIIYFFYDKLQWIGKLPGDIRIEKENFKFYFPFTTMILASLVISVLIRLFRNIF
jgi:ABC-type sulfate transport system permease component